MESTYYDERVITYFKNIFVFLILSEFFKLIEYIFPMNWIGKMCTYIYLYFVLTW